MESIPKSVASSSAASKIVRTNCEYLAGRGQVRRLPGQPVNISCKPTHYLLLDDRAAGDAGARIARGVAFHIIRIRVDHQRRSAVRENRMAVVTHRDSWRDHGRLRRPTRGHFEIWHIARFRAVRVFQSMMLHV